MLDSLETVDLGNSLEMSELLLKEHCQAVLRLKVYHLSINKKKLVKNNFQMSDSFFESTIFNYVEHN